MAGTGCRTWALQSELAMAHFALCLGKMFVPAGFPWTSSTLWGKSYVLLLLSWYFVLALGASELIKRPFRKRPELSLKSQGERIVGCFFKPGSECNALK